MQPEIAAMNAQDIKAATPNVKALQLMPDSYINNKAILLTSDLLAQSIIDSQLFI